MSLQAIKWFRPTRRSGKKQRAKKTWKVDDLTKSINSNTGTTHQVNNTLFNTIPSNFSIGPPFSAPAAPDRTIFPRSNPDSPEFIPNVPPPPQPKKEHDPCGSTVFMATRWNVNAPEFIPVPAPDHSTPSRSVCLHCRGTMFLIAPRGYVGGN